MFAVVRTGGKQYRVAAGDKIVVEKIDGEAGGKITLGDVLLAGEGGDLKPTEGLTVAAEIGHRQQHTILKILSVGAAENETKAPKARAAKPAAEAPAVEAAAPAAEA
jgi:large subunit ribosomal protein L21